MAKDPAFGKGSIFGNPVLGGHPIPPSHMPPIPKPATHPAPPKPVHATPLPKPASARALVNQFLTQYGLQSLGDWAWNRYLQLGGGDNATAQIQDEIVDRPEFQARFPAYKKLAQSGHAMSVAEMLAYENSAIGIMRQAGLPSGFYDQPADIGKFLENQVSVAELQQRVSIAGNALQAVPEVGSQLERLYGVDRGHQIAYLLDPDKSMPLIQQRFQAAQNAAQAQLTGYGQIDQGQAERLAQLGVDQNAAQQGFGQLAAEKGVFRAEAGQNPGDAISQDQQLSSIFEGNDFAKQRIARRAAQKQATFQGGSGFGAGQTGVTGLGRTGR